jgi:hypothetical protein
MVLLCESFHSLRGAPGTHPWNQHTFATWASGGKTDAERQAAAFVLSVWNGNNLAPWWSKKPFRVSVFDATLACAIWDEQNRAAFIAWCNDPFYP